MPALVVLSRKSFATLLVLAGCAFTPGLLSTLDAGPPPVVRGAVRCLEFTSDHNLICRNDTDILEGGERYPDVEWVSQPTRNAPITHTAGMASSIQARITLDLEGVLPGSGFCLDGKSKEPALCFAGKGTVPARGPVVLDLRALSPLGKGIRKFQEAIHWTLTPKPASGSPSNVDLGATGPHRVYTTLGTPRDTAKPLNAVTDIRMELAVQRVAAALAKVGDNASTPRLIQQLMKQNGDDYVPTRHYGGKKAWKMPETWTMNPRGASCISIVEFVVLLCKMIGLEGKEELAAFYARHTAPLSAVEGGLGDDTFFKKGFFGETWQLFLVDESNSLLGQVGGLGGMNYYEAALAYEGKDGKYYYPGGTDRVYDSTDEVLRVFCTLAWARWEPYQHDWVVMEVVQEYSRPNGKAPASVKLP